MKLNCKRMSQTVNCKQKSISHRFPSPRLWKHFLTKIIWHFHLNVTYSYSNCQWNKINPLWLGMLFSFWISNQLFGFLLVRSWLRSWRMRLQLDHKKKVQSYLQSNCFLGIAENEPNCFKLNYCIYCCASNTVNSVMQTVCFMSF